MSRLWLPLLAAVFVLATGRPAGAECTLHNPSSAVGVPPCAQWGWSRSATLPGQPVHVGMGVELGYWEWVHNTFLYFTTDGSAPSGSAGIPDGTSQVISGTYVCSSGGIDYYRFTLPAQAAQVQVRYLPTSYIDGDAEFWDSPAVSTCGATPGYFTYTPNTPPIANDDAFRTTVNRIWELDVVGNDVEPDGDLLEVLLVDLAVGASAWVFDNKVRFYAASPGNFTFSYRLRDPGGLTSEVASVIVSASIPLPVSAQTVLDPGHEICAAGGVLVESGLDDGGGMFPALVDNGTFEGPELREWFVVCNGVDGADGYDTLVSVTPEPPGLSCTHGGTRIRSGLDLNRNGLLDDGNTSTAFACNGAPGANGSDGSDGRNSLVKLTAADSCGAAGGQVVQSGVDANRNGLLDEGEASATAVICNGAAGSNGSDGADGRNSLVVLTPELAGDNCTWGGTKVQSAVDLNGNGELDDGGISTAFVCNGAPGADGNDGADGKNSLVSVEVAGAECGAAGGLLVKSGLDLDGDGFLDEGEVQRTAALCHGLDGADGSDGFTSLLVISEEPAGANCAFGGTRLETGLDLDRNGSLDDGNVATAFVCNGAPGANGSDGRNSLVSVADAGSQCAFGGFVVRSGVDDDGDGVLAPGEADATAYVCHGAPGANGSNGTNGRNSLLILNVEAPGPNCAHGGTKIQAGLDLDDSGTLEAGEAATSFVCNGAPGADGSDGRNGLLVSSVEPPGGNCAHGGTRLHTGLDVNRNGVLDSGEYVISFACNGAPGADGRSALLVITPEPEGANCAIGGSKVQAGIDSNGNGVLDAGEATVAYLCHGTPGNNGANGADGSDGADGKDGAGGKNSKINIAVEPAGANCASGGLRIQSGIDSDGDGTLAPDEVATTSYVCHGDKGDDGKGGCTSTGAASGLTPLLVLALAALRRRRARS